MVRIREFLCISIESFQFPILVFLETAEVLLERGKVKEALGMLQKCQEDRQHFLHPFHKDIGRGNDLIGKCHAMLGKRK